MKTYEILAAKAVRSLDRGQMTEWKSTVHTACVCTEACIPRFHTEMSNRVATSVGVTGNFNSFTEGFSPWQEKPACSSHQDGWAVKDAGNQRATSVRDTQQQAIEAGQGIARNQQAELVIHRPDGRIRDKDIHGNNSFPPKG